MAQLSPLMTHIVNSNAAAIGGIFATTATFPLDSLNKRQINAKKGEGSLAQVINKLLKEEGIQGLFKGLGSKLGWSFGGKFMFYGSYSIMAEQYKTMVNPVIPFHADMLLGYLSEWATLPVALPFEVIATRMQSGGETVTQAVAAVYKAKGIGGFFNGLSAYVILCITPAITNTIFEQIKKIVLLRKQSKSGLLSTFEAFLVGALARAISTTIMYPYLKAKTVLQSNKKSGGPKESATQVIMRLIKQNGFFGMYGGLPVELMRGVCSQSVTMMCKERIFALVRAMILSVAAKNAAKPALQ